MKLATPQVQPWKSNGSIWLGGSSAEKGVAITDIPAPRITRPHRGANILIFEAGLLTPRTN